jgi:hypothetical protein
VYNLLDQVTLTQFLPVFYVLMLTVCAVQGLFGSFGLAIGLAALAADIPLAVLFVLFLFRPVGKHHLKS